MEIRAVVAFGGGGELTRKTHMAIYWSDGKVLHSLSGGYVSDCIW